MQSYPLIEQNLFRTLDFKGREKKGKTNTFLAVALQDWNPIQAFLCKRSTWLAIAKNAPNSPSAFR